MNSWVTPFIVRIHHADWKLADAVEAKFGFQTVYSRYVKEGYGYYTYELFCVVQRDKVPDDKMALVDQIQTFAHEYIAAIANYDDESRESADSPSIIGQPS